MSIIRRKIHKMSFSQGFLLVELMCALVLFITSVTGLWFAVADLVIKQGDMHDRIIMLSKAWEHVERVPDFVSGASTQFSITKIERKMALQAINPAFLAWGGFKQRQTGKEIVVRLVTVRSVGGRVLTIGVIDD